jgi:uncharacterized membrane protein YqaE (UPF0057 family)
MRYLIAFFCPPLAILLCGKPIQAIICIPLCLAYFPAVLWALLVVSSHKADLRNRALMRNDDKNAKAQVKAIEQQTRELERQRRELSRALQEKQQPLQVIVVQARQPVEQNQPPTRGRSLPPGENSRSRPGPTRESVPAAQDGLAPPKPHKPVLTLKDIRDFLAQARDGAVFAYRNLPEWAQPITWGLAAATPVSVIIMIFALW